MIRWVAEVLASFDLAVRFDRRSSCKMPGELRRSGKILRNDVRGRSNSDDKTTTSTIRPPQKLDLRGLVPPRAPGQASPRPWPSPSLGTFFHSISTRNTIGRRSGVSPPSLVHGATSKPFQGIPVIPLRRLSLHVRTPPEPSRVMGRDTRCCFRVKIDLSDLVQMLRDSLVTYNALHRCSNFVYDTICSLTLILI